VKRRSPAAGFFVISILSLQEINNTRDKKQEESMVMLHFKNLGKY